MKNRRNLKIAIGIFLLFGSCFLLCSNIGLITEYIYKRNTVIAELDAGNDRVITITGEICYEIGRCLYYKAMDNEKIIAPKHLFDVVDGSDKRSNYSLIFADNKSLVGVLDITTQPAHLIVVFDFQSAETLQSRGDYRIEDMEAIRRTWYSRVQSLQQENPQVDVVSFIE